MARIVAVQLDDEAQRALRLLQSTGLSEAEAIRSSLLAAAERTESMRTAALDDTDDLLSDPATLTQINESRAALANGDVVTADQLRTKYLI